MNKTAKPRKRLSQNFLQDANIARKIVGSLRLSRSGVVLEIGPGTGILTRFLVQRKWQVLTIEYDSKLASELKASLNYPENLQVIEADILKTDVQEIMAPYKDLQKAVIGNLPYHITSPILFKLFDNAALFEQALFMVQKEVALRMTSQPGSKDYGILSVFCQYYSEPEFLFTVPSHLFYPKPTVDSGVVRLCLEGGFRWHLADVSLFRRIVRHTFNQRRKMLKNTLLNLFPKTILNDLDVDLSRRPETLTVAEFINLANRIHQSLKGDFYGQDYK